MKRFLVVAGVGMAGLVGCASDTAQKKGDNAKAPSAEALGRCEPIFDAIRPSLEKQWETTLPMDLYQKARSNLPDLKQEFSRECAATLAPADLACAEGDNSAALQECKSQPAEFMASCEQDAERNRNNPLYCKAVSALLDRVGASWMKSHDI